MTALVTGNLGYIGSVLTPTLARRGYAVRGLDSDLFANCTLSVAEPPLEQIWRDIRSVESSDLEGVKGVVHLAGLSNDPLGELDASLTQAINFEGTVRLGELAREMGVRRFVYASSQSMYGISATDQVLDEDLSEKNPLTAYARTKWEAELALMEMRAPGFEVTAFRPSTVFGASPRLRCDIVFNSFVACAFTTGFIEIKSDGTPRRPAIHILDVCEAFIAGLEADASLVDGRAFNVGVADGNYTVRQLALAAQAAVPESELVFTGEYGSDSRTYTVGFDRILGDLADHFDPSWDLAKGGAELSRFFLQTGFDEEHFRGGVCNRLVRIGELIETGRIDESLRMVEA